MDVPKFDPTSESKLGTEKEIETPKEIFQRVCFSRLNELVQEGIFPQGFADERRANATLIEDNLTNPEQQGKEFAEIGLDSIRKFREAVDIAESQTVQNVDAMLERINDLQEQIKNRKIVPINLGKIMKLFEATKQDLMGHLVNFRAEVEKVRNLEAGLSVAASEAGIKDALSQLEILLKDTEK